MRQDYFDMVITELQSGNDMEDLEGQEAVRQVFEHLIRFSDTERLALLLAAGLPVNYTMPEYLMKTIGSFVCVHLSWPCLQLIEQEGFNFSAPDCRIDSNNFFLYSITRSSLPFIQFFAEKGLDINDLGTYEKHALSFAVEQHDDAVFDYVFNLTYDTPKAELCLTDSPFDDCPLVIALAVGKTQWAQKMLGSCLSFNDFDNFQEKLKEAYTAGTIDNTVFEDMAAKIKIHMEQFVLQDKIKPFAATTQLTPAGPSVSNSHKNKI